MSVRVVAETPEYPQDDPAQQQLDTMLSRLSGLSMEPEPPPAPPPAPKVVTKHVLPEKQILQAMNGLGALLAARLMLLLAVIGAFALAWVAIQAPTDRAIWILAVYSAMIVAPLVWLSTRRI